MKKLLIATLIFAAACGGDKKTDECSSDECLKQQSYDKVIAVHDDVMPKLGQISDLKGQLEERMSQSVDSATMDNYIKLMEDLDTADEGMWVWMRAFKSNIEELPLDSALNYLASEQAKVDEVAEKINASIAAAEAALN